MNSNYYFVDTYKEIDLKICDKGKNFVLYELENTRINFNINFLMKNSINNLYFFCYDNNDIVINCNFCVSDLQANVVIYNFLSSNNTNIKGNMITKKKLNNLSGNFYQHNIILGDGFEIVNQPNLFINSKNVNIVHGVKIYNFEGENFFYLQSKGLDMNSYKKLILSGIIGSVYKKFNLSNNKAEIFVDKILKN